MSINARDKGQRGEREVAELLQMAVNEVYGAAGVPEAEWPQVERNLMQSMKGGHDLVGLDWLAVEVKRVEAVGRQGIVRKHTSGVFGWWAQAVEQANRIGAGSIPVLFYRPNNWTWSIRMYGYLAVGPNGGPRVKAPVVIELEPFMLWFKMELKRRLAGTEGKRS